MIFNVEMKRIISYNTILEGLSFANESLNKIIYLLTEKGILFVLKSVNFVRDFVQESWRVHFVFSSFFGRYVQLDGHGFHELFNFPESELRQLIPFGVGRPENEEKKKS